MGVLCPFVTARLIWLAGSSAPTNQDIHPCQPHSIPADRLLQVALSHALTSCVAGSLGKALVQASKSLVR